MFVAKNSESSCFNISKKEKLCHFTLEDTILLRNES